MSRSLKKGPYVNERLLAKIAKLKQGDKTIIKVWDRACTITPEMVGFIIGVHNGRAHTPVSIVENMVGHKLGEFSPTRKFVVHGGKMAKDQAKAEVAKETAAIQKAVPVAAAKPAKK
jgi:small subunit ribosomal protein S19